MECAFQFGASGIRANQGGKCEHHSRSSLECALQKAQTKSRQEGRRSMADQSIELTVYDPNWRAGFAEQQVRLDTILKPWLAGEIEHIGSTSVTGLSRVRSPAAAARRGSAPTAPEV